MAITEPYELDGVTVGASELSIVSGTTTLQSVTDDGMYQLWLDPVTNLAKGDKFQVRIKEKCLSGSTQRIIWQASIDHAQSEPWIFPFLPLMHGWDMTIQKIAGTDRAWDASIRAITGSHLTEYDTLSAVSIDGETSIISGTTTLQTVTDDGVYYLLVDGANLAKADEVVCRVYEKVEGTGGTKRQVFEQLMLDVQSSLLITPPLCLINGWDMTLERLSGTSRNFDASVRRIS